MMAAHLQDWLHMDWTERRSHRAGGVEEFMEEFPEMPFAGSTVFLGTDVAPRANRGGFQRDILWYGCVFLRGWSGGFRFVRGT